jgi:EpsI family protein
MEIQELFRQIATNKTGQRLVMVIGLVLVVHAGFYVVLAGTKPPPVAMPEDPAAVLKTLPMEWEGWRGKEEDLPPELFLATEATAVVSRRYRNEQGYEVSVHVALFADPAAGVYHNPGNCYLANGWIPSQSAWLPLQTATRPEIEVKSTLWEQKGDKALVLYWYEVEDYTLFERKDLWKVRWGMRGRGQWPPTVKVMIHVPAADAETAKVAGLELAGFVRQWIGTLDLAPPPVTP